MSRTKTGKSVAGLGVLLLALLSLPGCVCSSSNARYGPEGPAPGKQTLKQIKPGETTEAWLLSTLGHPPNRRPIDDGKTILKYHYSKKTDSSFVLAGFLHVKGQDTEYTNHYFEIKDGLITKFWKGK